VVLSVPPALFADLKRSLSAPMFRLTCQASSIGEFWSLRWNTAAGLLLRCMCFDPIVEGCLVRRCTPPSKQHAPALDAPQNSVVANGVAVLDHTAGGGQKRVSGVCSGHDMGAASHKSTPASQAPSVHVGAGVSKSSLMRRRRRLAKALGVFLTFTWSGIVHELVLLYMCSQHPGFGMWLPFFLVQVGGQVVPWLESFSALISSVG